MADSNKTKQRKKAMIAALEKSLGIVTPACKVAGINRATHYQWLKDDPEYADEVSELSNLAIDFAESKLHQQIKEGNTTAIIFFLKTQAKSRGYVERVENLNTNVEQPLFPLDE